MKIFILISIFLYSFSSTIAQVVTRFNEKELLNEEIIIPQLMNKSNVSFVGQLGKTNNFISIQQNYGEKLNLINSEQRGVENNSFINQTGTFHATALLQSGNHNDAQINSTGLSTSTEVSQNGDWNKVTFSIENKDDFLKAAQVLQNGSNNLVDLKITGNRLFGESDIKDAVVTQTGNNNSFSALLDSYKSSMVVNQQGGINGEGMKVDISTSDFYFPMK